MTQPATILEFKSPDGRVLHPPHNIEAEQALLDRARVPDNSRRGARARSAERHSIFGGRR